MKILVTGDCRIDGPFGASACGLPALFGDADLVILNAEFAVPRAGTPLARKSAHILASEQDVEFVINNMPCPVVFNVANNHSEDAGRDALDAWTGRARQLGARVAGTGGAVRIQLDDGRSIGLLAYAMDTLHGGIAVYDRRRAEREIAETAKATDFVIVLMHWGEEYVFAPSPAQRRIARTCAEAGAGLIAGCHPHVLQGHEILSGAQVFYSLGNTVFRLEERPAGTGAGGVLEIDMSSATPCAEMHPVTLDDDHRVVRLDPGQASEVERLLENELSRTGLLEWRRIASPAFFLNHMPSWKNRIHRYGKAEAFRMARAFCSRTYLKMCAGYLAGGFADRSQSAAAQRIDQLLCRKN